MQPTPVATPVLDAIVSGAGGTHTDLWSILTRATGAWPWLWPLLIGMWAVSRGLRAWFPTGASKTIQVRDDEIARLRGLLKIAGVDAGPVPELPPLDFVAGRPAVVAAILAIVSPLTTVVDALIWTRRSLSRAFVKRITGQDMPDDSDTLGLREPRS